MKKFKELKVCGHRRSGTHYITALISLNFLESYDYIKIYEKHKTPKKLDVKDRKHIFFIYVGREFEEVAKSIFKMRKRFGIDENNFENFLNRNYCDMYNKNLNPKVKVENFNSSRIITKVGGGLKNVKMTPYEYGKHDYNMGNNLNVNNVMLVKYNDIINNFESTLLEIGKKIGSNKTKFEKINKKIGGTPIK